MFYSSTGRVCCVSRNKRWPNTSITSIKNQIKTSHKRRFTLLQIHFDMFFLALKARTNNYPRQTDLMWCTVIINDCATRRLCVINLIIIPAIDILIKLWEFTAKTVRVGNNWIKSPSLLAMNVKGCNGWRNLMVLVSVPLQCTASIPTFRANNNNQIM